MRPATRKMSGSSLRLAVAICITPGDCPPDGMTISSLFAAGRSGAEATVVPLLHPNARLEKHRRIRKNPFFIMEGSLPRFADWKCSAGTRTWLARRRIPRPGVRVRHPAGEASPRRLARIRLEQSRKWPGRVRGAASGWQPLHRAEVDIPRAP